MKKIISLLLLCTFLFGFTGCITIQVPPSDDSSTTQATTNATPTSPQTTTDNTTMGEKMALAAAKNYLNVKGFSKKGLIDQLEYEGYTTSEATYAANNCGANWKEQAVRVAESYLKVMPFSKQKLTEQLEFEGFTSEEAAYGVEQVYK